MRPILLALLLALLSASAEARSGAADSPAGNRLAGLWLGLQQGVRFPLGCESGEPVRYSSDGIYRGPGASGTWELRNDRLTEVPQEVDAETGDPAAVGRTFVSRIVWQGPDRFVKTFSDGRRMTFRRCPEVRSPAVATGQERGSQSRSKAADFLVRGQIAEACEGKAGQIDPATVIERDLTGDGKDDLIISHEGITCSGGGRSLMCGMQVCSVMIYVREGSLLKLRVNDLLGGSVTVGRGQVPEISMHGHGGRRSSIRWNGREFRSASSAR